MAVTQSVQEYLRRSNLPYSVIRHIPAYTAQEEAAVTHVPGRDWAKAVICFVDGQPVQAVLPADHEVNLYALMQLAAAEDIRLADESELDWLFPDCERGAMPPFGPLYHQRVFVDESLTHEDEIVFNGGTHRDAVCMRYADFAALTRPVIGRFAQRVR
jgi:Ala-tRNA(Pro) deacylase